MPDIDKGPPRNPDDYRNLLEHPIIIARKRTIDIFAGALFIVQIVMAALAAMAVFVPVMADDMRPPLWWVLVFVAVTDAPVLLIVGKRLATQAAGKGFTQAAAAVVPMTVLPLAWCIMTTVLGMVSPLLGAGPAVMWAFIACGLCLHVPLYLFYRGKAVDLMLVELGREEDQRRRR